MRSIRKALVVDDDDDVLRLCRVSLETYTEWKVEVARTPEAAVEVARTELPDVILLDVMMPDGGGMAVLCRLKTYEATARIPVILMTAAAPPVANGKEHGAAGLIPKPFDPVALPDRILAIVHESAPDLAAPRSA
jgi:two-component system alkaline phosphatase synthesis response regulator PhoP